MAPLKIDILTLFPRMFDGPLGESLIGKARAKGLVDIAVHDLRSWSPDERHRKADDKPFGGGAGMVLQVEPIFRALKDLCGARPKPFVVYLSPQGKVLDQKLAGSLSQKKRLVLLCGHYEGVDERALEWVDQEVSIGDYVLTGGELPAMVLADALCRLVPGVVKEAASVENDSFFREPRLDHAHYTRPAEFRGMKVPEVLLSGDHEAIRRWRETNALENTRRKRPELLKKTAKAGGARKKAR